MPDMRYESDWTLEDRIDKAKENPEDDQLQEEGWQAKQELHQRRLTEQTIEQEKQELERKQRMLEESLDEAYHKDLQRRYEEET